MKTKTKKLIVNTNQLGRAIQRFRMVGEKYVEAVSMNHANAMFYVNKCGDEISLARLNTHAFEWSASATWRSPEEWAKNFDAWLEKHQKCGEGVLDVSLAGESEELLNILCPNQ